ncbi:MAG: hypothetical protein ABJC19_02120 [Gemmatimonadota bacterium]
MLSRWTWTLLLPLVAACQASEADSSPPFVVPLVTLPSWQGGLDVGRRRELWIDDLRQRPLAVWIFYPAALHDSSTTPVLDDSTWVRLRRNELSHRLGPAATSGLLAMRTHAITDAPVKPWDERFPVLLFAPAAGWLPSDYSGLLEGLASRGFVVVAAAAPGDAGVMLLPDGTVATSRTPDDGTAARLAGDLRFLRQRLIALDAVPASPFHRTLALSSVGALGHGAGGAAAVLAAAADTTIAAVVNLDGEVLRGFRTPVVGQAMLYLSTEPVAMVHRPVERWSEDRGERRRTEQWERLSASSVRPERVRLSGMHHWNFLDAALVTPEAVAPAVRRVRFGEIDGTRGIRIVADVAAEFFRGAFSHGAAGLGESRALYPEITLTR